MSGYSKTMLRKGAVKAHIARAPRGTRKPGGYSPCKESVSGQEESMLLDEPSRCPEKSIPTELDVRKGQGA